MYRIYSYLFIIGCLFTMPTAFGTDLFIDGYKVGGAQDISITTKRIEIHTENNFSKKLSQYDKIIYDLEKIKLDLLEENGILVKQMRYFVGSIFLIVALIVLMVLYLIFFRKLDISEGSESDIYRNNPVKKKIYERFVFFSKLSIYTQKLVVVAYLYLFIFSGVLLFYLLSYNVNNLSILLEEKFWEVAGIGSIPVLVVMALFKWADTGLVNAAKILETK